MNAVPAASLPADLCSFAPEVALVLGSGLDGVSAAVAVSGSLRFSQLTNGRSVAVPGHAGLVSWGRFAGRRVLLFRGRLHRYEGHDHDLVAWPVEFSAALGVRLLILTHAAGGIRADLQPGALMVVRGWLDWMNRTAPMDSVVEETGQAVHQKFASRREDSQASPSVSTTGAGQIFPKSWLRPPVGELQDSPLAHQATIFQTVHCYRPLAATETATAGGVGTDGAGRSAATGVPRWAVIHPVPESPQVDCLRGSARQIGLNLREGILAGVTGPNYETPAEIRALKVLGADAVGMSTVPELQRACALSLPVIAISCITNRAAGLANERLSHAEVLRQAAQLVGSLHRLLAEFLAHY